MARISPAAMSCCSDFEYREANSLNLIAGKFARNQRINDGLNV